MSLARNIDLFSNPEPFPRLQQDVADFERFREVVGEIGDSCYKLPAREIRARLTLSGITSDVNLLRSRLVSAVDLVRPLYADYQKVISNDALRSAFLSNLLAGVCNSPALGGLIFPKTVERKPPGGESRLVETIQFFPGGALLTLADPVFRIVASGGGAITAYASELGQLTGKILIVNAEASGTAENHELSHFWYSLCHSRPPIIYPRSAESDFRLLLGTFATSEKMQLACHKKNSQKLAAGYSSYALDEFCAYLAQDPHSPQSAIVNHRTFGNMKYLDTVIKFGQILQGSEFYGVPKEKVFKIYLEDYLRFHAATSEMQWGIELLRTQGKFFKPELIPDYLYFTDTSDVLAVCARLMPDGGISEGEFKTLISSQQREVLEKVAQQSVQMERAAIEFFRSGSNANPPSWREKSPLNWKDIEAASGTISSSESFPWYALPSMMNLIGIAGPEVRKDDVVYPLGNLVTVVRNAFFIDRSQFEQALSHLTWRVGPRAIKGKDALVAMIDQALRYFTPSQNDPSFKGYPPTLDQLSRLRDEITQFPPQF
ncbi:MAG: hypothetical protein WCP97_02975 [bacterium]